VSLVYDLGMCTGEDTSAYLAGGHHVVSVEANPTLVDAARRRFAAEIDGGWLDLVGCGVGDGEGSATFWINDACPVYSSFIREQAERYGTTAHGEPIPTVTLPWLLGEFGCPEYLKIDVEGFDELVIKQLVEVDVRPRFISAEGYGSRMVNNLANLGYDRFQWVNQKDHPEGSSGPWGEALTGRWLTADEVRPLLSEFYDTGRYKDPANTDWYDLHARLR
jgi:FkbM family methyltransferase